MNGILSGNSKGRFVAVRRSVRHIAFGLFCLSTSSCVLISGNVNPFSRQPQPLREHVVSGSGDAKILVLDVSGAITSEEERGAFGIGKREGMVSRIESELHLAEQDDDVRAVIVRINSPGGTVTASDILYHRLSRFRESRNVPVVAQLMDTAASGGYYVALAADEIVAHPTTVTGSIGVIFTSVSVAGLLDKVGVRNQTIKTGSKKDIGSPLRTMTPEERELLETLLGDMQDRFMGLVEERRPSLTPENRKLIGDGRILSAPQALAAGLVDRIGYLDNTIEVTKSRAGLSEARVILYRRSDELAENLYSRAEFPTPQINLINFDLSSALTTPQLLYLWMP
jgi:protease-4